MHWVTDSKQLPMIMAFQFSEFRNSYVDGASSQSDIEVIVRYLA